MRKLNLASGDPRWRVFLSALCLFTALVLAYHANRTVLDEGDAVPSINLPIALLAHGTLSFSPEGFPEMYKWKSHPPFRPADDFYFVSWRQLFGGKTTAEWHRSGKLEENGPRYYIVKSPVQNVDVSTFGPVPGMTLLPLMALVYACDKGLPDKYLLKLSLAKLHGSLLVAACAVLIYLMARRYVSGRRSLLVALAYGLGTCAWAISSQNVWQQTVSAFFVTLGVFFYLGDRSRLLPVIASGFALGAAVACRPTSAAVYAAVVAFLALRHRNRLLPFLLASVPIPLLVAWYNQHYFGSPVSFAQELVGHVIAEKKTGSSALWQTPLLEGALGLLLSPSRGLLVFSPFLALSFWGIARIWRQKEYVALRPLTVAVVLVMAVQCKWFDWWGGWTYGYRPWVDQLPLLSLFLVPTMGPVLATRWRRWALGAALAWSCFVQGLGAMTYDRLWNERVVYVIRLPHRTKPLAFTTEHEARAAAARGGGQYLGPSRCDIDRHFCRHRLWSVADSIIAYHLTHYEETRSRRLPPGWNELSCSSR